MFERIRPLPEWVLAPGRKAGTLTRIALIGLVVGLLRIGHAQDQPPGQSLPVQGTPRIEVVEDKPRERESTIEDADAALRRALAALTAARESFSTNQMLVAPPQSGGMAGAPAPASQGQPGEISKPANGSNPVRAPAGGHAPQPGNAQAYEERARRDEAFAAELQRQRDEIASIYSRASRIQPGPERYRVHQVYPSAPGPAADGTPLNLRTDYFVNGQYVPGQLPQSGAVPWTSTPRVYKPPNQRPIIQENGKTTHLRTVLPGLKHQQGLKYLQKPAQP